ncbi:hypothetical protein [Tessaracoccus sp.]
MEPQGLLRVGVSTLIVGLVLGIIVPFAQFGGVFTPPWVLAVAVFPLLWAAIWAYLARRRNRGWILLAQWSSLSLACWLFFGAASGWVLQAALAGVIFGTLLLGIWMVPVWVIAAFPSRR